MSRTAQELYDEALRLSESATAEARPLLMNDTDFLRTYSMWMKLGRSQSGIVFWAQNLAIGPTIRQIVQYAMQTEPADSADMIHFLH